MKNADRDAIRAFGRSSCEADEAPAGAGDGPDRARDHRQRLRRREIERVVADRTGPITIDALTDLVVQWESARTDDTVARIDLREQLFEEDLPSLERRGKLSFEIDRGLVRSPDEAGGGGLDDAVEYGHYYAAAIGCSFALLGLSRAAVGPFAALSPSVTTAVSLLLVTLVAVADRTAGLANGPDD
jgi:hypothetical protein